MEDADIETKITGIYAFPLAGDKLDVRSENSERMWKFLCSTLRF
jgi:hypothetical protein